MESLSIASTANLLSKLLDMLKNKDEKASDIASDLLKNEFDMKIITKSTTLVSTSDRATKVFLKTQRVYIEQLRRKRPKPRLTHKRKTQMLIAYNYALGAYYASWDYIQKATLMDGMSKLPTAFVPEEFMQYIEDIKKE